MPVTNVKSRWLAGDLIFESRAGTELMRLDGTSGVMITPNEVKQVRGRFTVAQINAGVELLAAVPGFKYRVVDMALIAIGGAVTAATTVDVLATQTTGVKLLAAAVAALTENALLRAGATNATILAAGVSFVANDVNTAITVGVTGSDAATATHVDVLASYVLEAA